MDTLKILLGATVALLIGALGVSWKNMKDETNGADKKVLADMQRQLNDMRLEQERLQLEKARLELQQASIASSQKDEESSAASARAAARAELEQMEAEKQAAAAAATRDRKLDNEEGAFREGMSVKARDKELKSAEMVANALLIARIKEWVSDPSLGDFGTIDVVRQDSIQPGSMLLIRRNTGVLGKLRVGEISVEGAVVNPVTAFAELKPQAGDELILEPPFYNSGE